MDHNREWNQIVVSIPKSDTETKEKLQELAESDNRTLSNQCYTILSNYLKRKAAR